MIDIWGGRERERPCAWDCNGAIRTCNVAFARYRRWTLCCKRCRLNQAFSIYQIFFLTQKKGREIERIGKWRRRRDLFIC